MWTLNPYDAIRPITAYSPNAKIVATTLFHIPGGPANSIKPGLTQDKTPPRKCDPKKNYTNEGSAPHACEKIARNLGPITAVKMIVENHNASTDAKANTIKANAPKRE